MFVLERNAYNVYHPDLKKAGKVQMKNLVLMIEESKTRFFNKVFNFNKIN